MINITTNQKLKQEMANFENIEGEYKRGKQYFDYKVSINIPNEVYTEDGTDYSLLSSENKTVNICRTLFYKKKPVGILVVYNFQVVEKEVKDRATQLITISEDGKLVGIDPEFNENLAIIVVHEEDEDLFTKKVRKGIAKFMSENFIIGRGQTQKIPDATEIQEAISKLIKKEKSVSPLTSNGGVLKPGTK
ncbi:hypothetical protein [Dokdonia sp. PRO95]|uniref:hypothetical protein n=1 Tax=Dokdonia sp. PRO95 TaxID=1239415 RepID=UPI00054F8A43|nr:hypothetical protein [Dokdonia sp. PRO95]